MIVLHGSLLVAYEVVKNHEYGGLTVSYTWVNPLLFKSQLYTFPPVFWFEIGCDGKVFLMESELFVWGRLFWIIFGWGKGYSGHGILNE